MRLVSIGRNAIVVIAGIILAYVLSIYDYEPFIIVGNITRGLPSFTPPPFSTVVGNVTYNFEEMLTELGQSLVTVPLIAVLESIAIAKSFGKPRLKKKPSYFVSCYHISHDFFLIKVNPPSISIKTWKNELVENWNAKNAEIRFLVTLEMNIIENQNVHSTKVEFFSFYLQENKVENLETNFSLRESDALLDQGQWDGSYWIMFLSFSYLTVLKANTSLNTKHVMPRLRLCLFIRNCCRTESFTFHKSPMSLVCRIDWNWKLLLQLREGRWMSIRRCWHWVFPTWPEASWSQCPSPVALREQLWTMLQVFRLQWGVWWQVHSYFLPVGFWHRRSNSYRSQCLLLLLSWPCFTCSNLTFSVYYGEQKVSIRHST